MGDGTEGGARSGFRGRWRPARPVHGEGLPVCMRDRAGFHPQQPLGGWCTMTCLTRCLARSTPCLSGGARPAVRDAHRALGSVGGWRAGSRGGCWPPPVWPLQCPELRMPCGFQAVPQTPAEAAGPGESARPLPAVLILASGCVAASLQPLLPSHGLSSHLVSLRGTLVAGLGAYLGSPG